MRVLLMSSAEKGHLNPLVGVAQCLRDDGHHVGWLTLPEPAAQLDGLGVESLRLPGHVAAPPLVTSGAELARMLRDEAALRGWIRMLLLDAVPGQVEPVRAALRAFRPDRIGLDGMLYAGVIAAELERLPYVGISSALTLLEPRELDSALMRNVRALQAERQALFGSYGLNPQFRTCEALSPRANAIFATRAFVGEQADVPPATELVGPSLPKAPRGDECAFPWERLRGDRPIVYASFGSQISYQPELFRRIAEAAAPLGVQLVLSAGELAENGFADTLPGDVLAVPYAPQLQLLPRVSAFVSHGGANSVMEALWQGVPLVLLPLCNDQFVQAFFLKRAGCGVAFDDGEPGVTELREALCACLDPHGPIRARLQAVQASYAHADGARAAAHLVLEG